jgi:hypothetical protein
MMRKYFENFIDEFYKGLSKDLSYIFSDYHFNCLKQCLDYSKVGMYDKLEKHCNFFLVKTQNLHISGSILELHIAIKV